MRFKLFLKPGKLYEDDEKMRERISDVVAGRGARWTPWGKSEDEVRIPLLLLLSSHLISSHPISSHLLSSPLISSHHPPTDSATFGAQALLKGLEAHGRQWSAVADLVEGYGELLTWQLFAPVIVFVIQLV